MWYLLRRYRRALLAASHRPTLSAAKLEEIAFIAEHCQLVLDYVVGDRDDVSFGAMYAGLAMAFLNYSEAEAWGLVNRTLVDFRRFDEAASCSWCNSLNVERHSDTILCHDCGRSCAAPDPPNSEWDEQFFGLGSGYWMLMRIAVLKCVGKRPLSGGDEKLVARICWDAMMRATDEHPAASVSEGARGYRDPAKPFQDLDDLVEEAVRPRQESQPDPTRAEHAEMRKHAFDQARALSREMSEELRRELLDELARRRAAREA